MSSTVPGIVLGSRDTKMKQTDILPLGVQTLEGKIYAHITNLLRSNKAGLPSGVS